MTTALEMLARYESSPEHVLTDLLPMLHQFRQHHDACLRDSLALHPDVRRQLKDALAAHGVPGQAVSDPSAAEAAAKVTAACAALIARWNCSVTEIEGTMTAVPGDGFAKALAVLDDPVVVAWNNGQPLQQAYSNSYWEVYRQAQAEHDAESKIRVRASIVVGSRVALTLLGGEPVDQTEVTGGSAEEGFVCADGTRLKFNDGGGGRWLIDRKREPKSGALFSTACEARPARGEDLQMIAVMRGTLARRHWPYHPAS
ncbi:MAG: hypothetical protein F8N36_12110 [Desulfovibrio sp.]|uniref:hypothetical protein n=1 Tax=Desulfovibrio sp. TaxID=885 RepID=UPI00135D5AF5|nr:hypothetical protein [Desulfovibrio sp.]MTJ93592.1 hypothetical protein [Desulfovibrio sp.]